MKALFTFLLLLNSCFIFAQTQELKAEVQNHCGTSGIDDCVFLTWTIKQNNQHYIFEVERSYDGITFDYIGATKDPAFTDTNIERDAYYQLIDVEFSGRRIVYPSLFVRFKPTAYEVKTITGAHLDTYSHFYKIPKESLLIINDKKVFIR